MMVIVVVVVVVVVVVLVVVIMRLSYQALVILFHRYDYIVLNLSHLYHLATSYELKITPLSVAHTFGPNQVVIWLSGATLAISGGLLRFGTRTEIPKISDTERIWS